MPGICCACAGCSDPITVVVRCVAFTSVCSMRPAALGTTFFLFSRGVATPCGRRQTARGGGMGITASFEIPLSRAYVFCDFFFSSPRQRLVPCPFFFVSQRSPPQGVRGGDNQTSKGSAALALCDHAKCRVEWSFPRRTTATGFSPPPSLSTRASAIRKTLGLQHSISSWSSQRWVSQLTVHPRPTSTTFEGAKSAASSPLRRPP